MNTYTAFYKNRKLENIEASSSYEAQQKAAKLFNARKRYEVSVMLASNNGEQVVHAPIF